MKEPRWRAAKAVCKKCNTLIVQGGKRIWRGQVNRKPHMGLYCSDVCYHAHIREIREGAPERVKAYLAKQKRAE